jgi:hypothetical protein
MVFFPLDGAFNAKSIPPTVNWVMLAAMLASTKPIWTREGGRK